LSSALIHRLYVIIFNVEDNKFADSLTLRRFILLSSRFVLLFIVNRSAWKKLTPDLQAIVSAATTVHAREQMTKSKLWESQAVAEMETKGLQWSAAPSDADKAAWAKAGAGLWDEYSAADKYSKELIDILRKEAN
jgi:TRAP-type C4-dicarboxylate transport system substrate-binding protein